MHHLVLPFAVKLLITNDKAFVYKISFCNRSKKCGKPTAIVHFSQAALCRSPHARLLLSFYCSSYHNPKHIDNLSCFALALGRLYLMVSPPTLNGCPIGLFARPRACGYLSRARHLLQST